MAYKLPGKSWSKTKINKSIYLPEDMVERLEEYARKANTTFSGLVTDMLNHCIAELEEEE